MQAQLTPLSAVGDPLLGAWRDLATHALETNPYFEPEMLLPASRHLDPEGRVALLTVHEGEVLRFLLPVVRRSRMHHVPVAATTTWLHDHAYLGTPLLAPDEPDAAWACALDELVRDRRAPRLVLHALPHDGPVRAALDAALAPRPGRPASVDTVERAVLRRRPDGSYLEGRMSASRRKRLRRARRGLSEALGADAVVDDRATRPDTLPGAVDAFLGLEASGWKGRAGTAMACSPAQAAFFRDMCEGFARQGRLGLVSLAAGQVDVAMACLVVAGDTSFHLKVAYDEAHRHWSPGLQLELELVSHFHADPRQEWIDSGSDGADTVSAQLYPQRRLLSALLVPLRGPLAHAASRSTPMLLGAGRMAKRRLAERRPAGDGGAR